MYRQILLKKTRVALNENKVFGLNIGGLSNNISRLLLGLIRDQDVFGLIKLQETLSSGFNIPCYDSFHSEKVMNKTKIRINTQIHGLTLKIQITFVI